MHWFGDDKKEVRKQLVIRANTQARSGSPLCSTNKGRRQGEPNTATTNFMTYSFPSMVYCFVDCWTFIRNGRNIEAKLVHPHSLKTAQKPAGTRQRAGG